METVGEPFLFLALQMIPEIALHGHRGGHFIVAAAGHRDPVAAADAQGQQPQQAVGPDRLIRPGDGDGGIRKPPGNAPDLEGSPGMDAGGCLDGMLESFHDGSLLLGLRTGHMLGRFHPFIIPELETFPIPVAFKHTPIQTKMQVFFCEHGHRKRATRKGRPERVKKECHCEEPTGDVAIRIPKMLPFWPHCIHNRNVLGNGLPRGYAPRNDILSCRPKKGGTKVPPSCLGVMGNQVYSLI